MVGPKDYLRCSMLLQRRQTTSAREGSEDVMLYSQAVSLRNGGQRLDGTDKGVPRDTGLHKGWREE